MVSTATVQFLFFVVFMSYEAIAKPPKVLVISFDAFHDSYMKPEVVPDLVNFRDSNASALFLESVFPATTFVNHYSIATGLYPDKHGVLADKMFDSCINSDLYGVPEQYQFDPEVVPLWIQNQYTNINGEIRHSGTMWPGSCFEYQGRHPTHCERIDINKPWKDRVHTFMSWINDPKQPANLVMVYFEIPDIVGHKYGTQSPEISEATKTVEEILMYIIKQIKEAGLENEINLIVLSGHGMGDVTFHNVIYFDDYVDMKIYENKQLEYKTCISSCNGFVHAEPDMLEEVYTYFKHIADNSQKFMVYKQSELRDNWHIKSSTRLDGKLYLLAKPGYAFWTKEVDEVLQTTTESKFRIGVHGYDNDEPTMHALFMASGPNFKKNIKTTVAISLMEVHPLLKHLLGLEEAASEVQSNRPLVDMAQLLSSNDDAKHAEHLSQSSIALP